MDLIKVSQDLLGAAKTKKDFSLNKSLLHNISANQLMVSLKTDDKKKAFWINIYNGFALDLLRPNPKVILNSIARKRFFRKKQITIAGCIFSLNDIEHQILRKSRVWWSKGYLKNGLVSDFEKQLRVEKLDPRIHFALNCGGKGCPPIRYYEANDIDNQLDIATQAFLFSEVKNDANSNTVLVSRLFNWYIGDFGGKLGIIDFLKKYKVIGMKENPKLVYNDYNWEPWIK